MQILLDNLTATLVAGTVLLVLLAMQTRIAEMNVQQTVTYMSKKYSLDFADWLQDDLLKLGRNMEADETAFDAIDTEDGHTVGFTFYRDSLRFGGGAVDTLRIATRYVLGDEDGNEGVPMETRTIDGETIELFRLTRKQKMWNVKNSPPASWTKTGSNVGLLEHFEIRMLNGNGNTVANPASNPESVKQMHAQFALVPPFEQGGEPLRAMQWGTSLLLRY